MKKTLTVNLGGTVFHIDEDLLTFIRESSISTYFSKKSKAFFKSSCFFFIT